MKIFLVSTSFNREYGGPAYSVSRLGLALAENGASVGLWAPDESAAAACARWPNQPLSSSPKILTGRIQPAAEEFGPIDIIHDSGIWLQHNHALSQFAAGHSINRVVSTRGMLNPWAMNHGKLKKNLAWLLYQKRDLTNASGLHVTSEEEAEWVAQLDLKTPIWNISNGVDLPLEKDIAFQSAEPALRRAVFLGRLHPVKGLPTLLDAWAAAKTEGWELLIAGPEEGGHLSELEHQVGRLKLEGLVRFHGQVQGAEKANLLRDADLFILPSLSESFGMVVAEALAHGLPVLTTKNVPWPQLETISCGWRVASERSELSGALTHILALPRQQLLEAGKRGRKLVSLEFGWNAVANSFLKNYEALLVGRSK